LGDHRLQILTQNQLFPTARPYFAQQNVDYRARERSYSTDAGWRSVGQALLNSGDIRGTLNGDLRIGANLRRGIAPSAIAPLCNQGGTTPINGQVLCLNAQGNERRNQLVGRRLVDADLSLVKNIRIPRISEAFNLQVRVEAFNIFNRANFQAPTNHTTFGGRLGFNQESPGTAGLLDSTATPSRQVQLGAR